MKRYYCLMGFYTGPHSIPTVWELQFHHHYPHHLFTCSQDSSLWHWDSAHHHHPPPPPPHILPPSHHHTHTHTHTPYPTTVHVDEDASPWISGAVQQGRVDVSNLLPNNKLPVNSLDIESSHVVCGTDSEMLFLVPNLTLR